MIHFSDALACSIQAPHEGELRDLGAFHAQRGIGRDHLLLGGTVLLGTLEDFFGSLHPAAKTAWSSAYSNIITTMQEQKMAG